MHEREKTDATDIEPDDATPAEDAETPELPEADPEHVVEKAGEEG